MSVTHTRYALVTTVRFHDAVVEQRQTEPGRPLVLGGDGDLAVPLPVGVRQLATCTWMAPDRVRVVDGRGREQIVDPDHDAEIALGPVAVSVALAPRFSLRRSYRFDTLLSLAWLAVVLMATNATYTGMMVWEHACPWVVLGPARPIMPTAWQGRCLGTEGSDDRAFTAEYIARLLMEDLDGEQIGVVSDSVERPEADRRSEKFYLPAGNEGPLDRMGGAAETAPEPVRTPARVEPPLPEKGGEPLLSSESGTPVELPEVADELGALDGLTEPEPADEEVEPSEAPAEEQRGWGIRDWYDESDERVESVEIEQMLRAARAILKIDPDSLEALSILSYYQYLGQDYDGALDTYDRYISLAPDAAAGYNNKALVYKRRGDYVMEERLYRVALALEPNDVTAINNLAVCLAHQGRFEEALALMAELEVLDPEDAYADLHRAKIHAAMGRDEEALRYLALSLDRMQSLDTLHHIEFRQDIRVDPAFARLRESRSFRDVLVKYYGKDSPLAE